MQSHHLGLLLSNVSQGQGSLNVNSVWQTSKSTAKARQELHDWLKAGRMSSIAQNLESDNELLNFTSGNSLDNYFMDWLWKEQKKTSFTLLMPQLKFSHIIHIKVIHTLRSSAGQVGFSTQYFATMVP